MTDHVARDWQALAREVRRRREHMDLRQSDIPGRGGPSHGTVQNVEQAARDRYASRTLRQLERALSWSDGAVGRILDGCPTDVDLDPNQRFGNVTSQDRAPADDTATSTVHAKTGGAAARAVGSGVDDLTRRVAQLVGTLASTPLRTDAEEAALRALSVLLAERLDPLQPDPEDEQEET